MELREYLFRKRMTLSQFGELVDYTGIYVGMVARGKKPGRKFIKRVIDATNGEVTFEEVDNELHKDVTKN